MTRRKVSSTECVHAGIEREDTSHSLTPPIVHSAPFSFASTRELVDYQEGRSERTQAEYGRMSNPTVTSVERRLAALEGADRAQLFSSGMAAVTSLFFTILKSGDHLILTSDSYRRTRDFGFFLGKFGVEMDVVDPAVEAIEEAIRPRTRIIFTEVPTNPYLRILDLGALCTLAKKNRILSIVDSTFATPINLRPLDVGVDYVTHSATKYLGGHNDLIAGSVAGRSGIMEPIVEMLMTLGGICDPNTAFLLSRGLKTLSVRVNKQNENGQQVAEFLESHSQVERVFYPGLRSHQDHEVANRLLNGFGGVVTFLIKGGFDETARFIDSLEIPRLAPSLGGVESLVDHVAPMSFWNLPPAERRRVGIKDNLVRLALGIEEAEDIIRDLENALASV